MHAEHYALIRRAARLRRCWFFIRYVLVPLAWAIAHELAHNSGTRTSWAVFIGAAAGILTLAIAEGFLFWRGRRLLRRARMLLSKEELRDFVIFLDGCY